MMTSFGMNAGCASKPVVGYRSIAAPLLPAGQGVHVGLRQVPPAQPLPATAPELPPPELLLLPELPSAPESLLPPEALPLPEPVLPPELLPPPEPLLPPELLPLPEAPFAVPEPLLVLPVLLAVPPPPASTPGDGEGAVVFDVHCVSSASATRHEATIGFITKKLLTRGL
jgi:hypothetical protein